MATDTTNQNHLDAIAEFERGDKTDTAIARQLGVSRQLISRWHAKWRVKQATPVRGGATDPATDLRPDSRIDEKREELDNLNRIAAKEMSTGNQQGYRAALRETQVAAILQSLARGSSRSAAFAAAGVPKSTGWRWLQTDLAFREAVERAEAEMVRSVSGRIYDIAMTAPPSVAWVSGMTLLERLRPGEYGRKDRIEHDVYVEKRIDMNAVLASEETIRLVSELEVSLQQAESAVPKALPAPIGDVSLFGRDRDT